MQFFPGMILLTMGTILWEDFFDHKIEYKKNALKKENPRNLGKIPGGLLPVTNTGGNGFYIQLSLYIVCVIH